MQQSTVLISGRVSKISCFRYILRWPERRVRRPLTLPFLIHLVSLLSGERPVWKLLPALEKVWR